MYKVFVWVASLTLVCILNAYTWAYTPTTYQFANEAEEQRYQNLINELRCPKCQNQNLAGSDAPIAQDLKQKTFELISKGQTDAQVRQYMIDRYGSFITYKPAFSGFTAGLYLLPFILLLILLVGWVFWTKKLKMTAKVTPSELTESEAKQLELLLKQQRVDQD